ncbi:Calx-beta domain-containing protein [Gayadomonas joobiniege]|uniref:Calx-beta domain-containing protein n=1 Tax=Gayadomonas joobiniege TaxID=1234606 RepID=UPI00035C2297|nr:Calx-beta domain-containing protein [Gayadomonas joobiniege]
MKYSKLALLIASLCMTSGCSFIFGSDDDDDNGTTPPPKDDDSEVVIVEPEAPDYPSSTQLTIKLTDEQGNALNNTNISILSDPSMLVTSVDGTLLNIDQSKLTDENLDGQLDAPKSVTLTLAADGYLSQRSVALVKNFGDNEQSFELTQANENNLVAEGIFAQTTEVNLANSQTNEEGLVELPVKENSPLKTEVKISPATVFLDENGEQVDSSEIKVSEVSYTPDSPKLPVLPAEKASNLAAYNQAVGDTEQVTEGSEVQFKSLGVVDIKVTAGDKKVTNLLAENPLTVTISIPQGSENPNTGEPIKAGDKVPVWSLSESDSNWVYEGLVEVMEGELGALTASFTTTHLTQFNLAYVTVSQTCSGFIYVKDTSGHPFSETGTFSFNNVRFSNSDNYLGSRDGRISFHKVPDEPTDISFKNADNSVNLVLEQTTVNYNTDVENIRNTLPGVDLCKASGSTLTLVGDSPTPEVTIVSPNRVYNYVVEGDTVQQQDIELQLTNANDEPVEVSYRVRNRYGATDGEDFTAKADSIVLSADSPTGTITFDILGDEEPEAIYESIAVDVSLPDGINFTTGHNQQTRYYYVRDDDVFVVNSFETISANEADGKATVRVNLDKTTPDDGYLYLYYRAFTDTNDTAEAHADYEQYQYSKSYINGGRYQYHQIPNGVSSFDLDIPLVDDISVEGDESFTVEILKNQYISADSDRILTSVTISDDDSSTDTATVLTLELTGTSADQNGNETLTESQFAYAKLSLNQATDQPVTVILNSSNGDRLYFGSSKQASISVTFAAGEAYKVIPVIAANNYKVDSDVEVSITATPDSGLASQSETVKVLDDDYTYVSMRIRQTPNEVFEDIGQDVIWTFNYYTSANDGNDGFTLTPSISAQSTATEGSDYSVDMPTSLSFKKGTADPQITFTPTADTQVESSEWVIVNFSGTLPTTPGYRYYLPGQWWSKNPGDTVNFSKSFVIGNDDIFTIAVPNQREFRVESASDGNTFEAKPLNDVLKVTTNGSIDFDLTFNLSLLSNEQTNMQLLALTNDTITLPQGTSEVSVDLNLLASTANSLGVDESNLGEYKALVKVELTDQSLQQLKENGLEFVVTNSSIELDFVYFVSGSTPTTGGTGGSGNSVGNE